MTEPVTEAGALGLLLETVDYEAVIAALKAAELASNDFDTRTRLMRLITVIGIDMPAVTARHEALTAEVPESVPVVLPDWE